MSAGEDALKEQARRELAEIEYAISLLEKKGDRRFYIQLPGGAMLEVSRDEALEYLEKKRSQLLALISKLGRETG